MMFKKYKAFLTIFSAIFIVLPNLSFADTVCLSSGYTISTVNGIFTDRKKAEDNEKWLKYYVGDSYKDQKIDYQYLLNPSHLGGIGDIVKSIQQGIFDQETVNDYDLVEMLKDASEKVRTQKLLLVAHSQGNFYANSFYDIVLAQNAPVSKESMSIYSVATPASRVAGDGKWLTSDTDTVIADIVGRVPFKKIMEPNTSITLKEGDDFLGHDFANVYLKYKSARIIADIESSLNKLQTKNIADAQTPCIAPPKLTRAHKIEGALFAVVDPVASKSISAVGAIATGAYQTGNAIATTLVKGISSVANTLASVFETSSKEQASAVAETLNPNGIAEKNITQNEEPHASVDMLFALEQPEQKMNVSEIATETLEKDIATAQTTVSDDIANNILQKEIIPNTPPASPLPYPGFGGGGDATQKTNIAADNIDTTPPNAPAITSPENFSGVFSTTTLSFTGTSEASAIIEFVYTPSGATTVATTTANADGNGSWSFSNRLFGQGTTTVKIYAKDQAGNMSTPTTVAVKVDTRPPSPTVSSPSNLTLPFTTTTITFSGTASSTNIISNSWSGATTTANSAGNWTLTLSSLLEGTTTVQFVATDSFSLSSAPTTIDVAIDTIAPSQSMLTILECQYSLVTGSCFSGGNTVHLSWTSTSTDIAYHSIVKDGLIAATTTSASSTVTFSANGTYSLSIVAYDHAGNTATSSAQSVETYESPVVINEIAWAGTKAASSDEWIEIYNRGTHAIDLSNIFLSAEDGVPYLRLSGSIASGGFYLIERTSSTTTSVSSDLVAAFSGIGSGSGLGNEGEVLRLIHDLGGQASTTLDSTPSLSSCGGTWCAGEASTSPISMERKNPDVSGLTASNWSSNNTYTKNGTDANSNIIYGTPRARNSTNLLSIGYYCPSYSSTYVENGYYIPSSGTCTYLSPTLSGDRYGDLYKGVIGNATIINGHYLSTSTSTQQGDALSSPSQGDTYFTAIYQIQNDPDVAAFRSYFMTGGANPPHLNYGVLNWKYGINP